MFKAAGSNAPLWPPRRDVFRFTNSCSFEQLTAWAGTLLDIPQEHVRIAKFQTNKNAIDRGLWRDVGAMVAAELATRKKKKNFKVSDRELWGLHFPLTSLLMMCV